MARFVKGDVVVVPFPFSEAAGSKVRPVLILTVVPYARRSDYLVCAITSQAAPDPDIQVIEASDMTEGSLNRRSYLRPSYVFTAGEGLVSRKIGQLSPQKVGAAVRSLVAVLQR